MLDYDLVRVSALVVQSYSPISCRVVSLGPYFIAVTLNYVGMYTRQVPENTRVSIH